MSIEFTLAKKGGGFRGFELNKKGPTCGWAGNVYIRPMQRKLRLAYFAGLIDGEGNISIRERPRRRAYVIVRVNMTCQNTILELANFFGGKCRPKKVYNGNKPQWLWELIGPKARDVIEELQPYLITKAENAKKCLALSPVLTYQSNKGKTCTATDCQQVAIVKGVCAKHYRPKRPRPTP